MTPQVTGHFCLRHCPYTVGLPVLPSSFPKPDKNTRFAPLLLTLGDICTRMTPYSHDIGFFQNWTVMTVPVLPNIYMRTYLHIHISKIHDIDSRKRQKKKKIKHHGPGPRLPAVASKCPLLRPLFPLSNNSSAVYTIYSTSKTFQNGRVPAAAPALFHTYTSTSRQASRQAREL